MVKNLLKTLLKREHPLLFAHKIANLKIKKFKLLKQKM